MNTELVSSLNQVSGVLLDIGCGRRIMKRREEKSVYLPFRILIGLCEHFVFAYRWGFFKCFQRGPVASRLSV